MTRRQMHEQTQRCAVLSCTTTMLLVTAGTCRRWLQLAEVREKKELERRKVQAATNRIRVKLYQQVCLNMWETGDNHSSLSHTCLPTGCAGKTEE